MEYEVEGPRPRGRPKRTWRDFVWEDCQARKLNKEDAVDWCKWKKVINDVRWSVWVWVGECFFWYRPTRVVPDKRLLNSCVCVRACACACMCVCVCVRVCWCIGWPTCIHDSTQHCFSSGVTCSCFASADTGVPWTTVSFKHCNPNTGWKHLDLFV